MRIALAQINPTVGDIAGNAQLIKKAISQARDQQAALVVFPELALVGYPPKDLLLKPRLIEQCAKTLQELARDCTDIAALIGYPMLANQTCGLHLHNAAAFCAQGQVLKKTIKSLLPTYDVFDERRYFEPNRQVNEVKNKVIDWQNYKLGVSICEDLWTDQDLLPRQLYHTNPIEQLAQAGADVLVNCSASPFVLGKHDVRLKLLKNTAKRYRLPLLYCNQVGGNDELVFDGNSCVINSQGHIIAHAKSFESDLLIVDLPPSQPQAIGTQSASAQSTNTPSPSSPTYGLAVTENRPSSELSDKQNANDVMDESINMFKTKSLNAFDNGSTNGLLKTPYKEMASVYHALVLGLKDYMRKSGFKSIVLGLSGGIDSAVCCALAVAAVGSENVTGVAMPSRYSSQGSVDDAAELAKNCAMQYHHVPIESPHAAMENLLQPYFKDRAVDMTEENIQARLRGVILMAFSNKFGSLLVTTGNKSELAVGYCTLYGDMCGGLAILSDLPKTMVWQLARWINEDQQSPLKKQFGMALIPENSITKPPSAELRDNQTDQDSLPPYELLDRIVELYVEQEKTASEIVSITEFDPEMVLRFVQLIDRNEYKRKQAAPGLKITGRAFGFGRRMPIAQRYDNRQGNIATGVAGK